MTSKVKMLGSGSCEGLDRGGLSNYVLLVMVKNKSDQNINKFLRQRSKVTIFKDENYRY